MSTRTLSHDGVELAGERLQLPVFWGVRQRQMQRLGGPEQRAEIQPASLPAAACWRAAAVDCQASSCARHVPRTPPRRIPGRLFFSGQSVSRLLHGCGTGARSTAWTAW